MTKIPKIIHYCWLSDEKIPDRIVECMNTWKEHMPDYEVIHWDMNHFDIHSVPWVEQAVEAKKWAFAADYIRIYALYNYGGIYMDTDVRVIKNFDHLLENKAFTGIEFWPDVWSGKAHSSRHNGVEIEAAILGSVKGLPVFKAMLNYYQGRNFSENGELDTKILPQILSEILIPSGFDRTKYKEHQILDNGLHIYPYDYFASRQIKGCDPNVTSNTVAMHLISASWENSPPPPRRLHSAYTEWRLHTKEYFKNLWRDVIVRDPEAER